MTTTDRSLTERVLLVPRFLSDASEVGFDIVMNGYKYRNCLRKEVKELQKYFHTQQGMTTLLDLYLRAELHPVDEPSGYVLPNNTFQHAIIPEAKTKIVTALQEKDFDGLIKLVRENIHFGNEFDRKVLQKVEDLSKSPDTQIDLTSVLFGWMKSWTMKENPPADGICIHAHPGSANFGLGYSGPDVSVAFNKTLGLVEYQEKVVRDTPQPYLVLEFGVYHRICLWKRQVAHLKYEVHSDTTTVREQGKILSTFPTPKKTVDFIEGLFALLGAPKTLPLISWNWDTAKNIGEEMITPEGLDETTIQKVLEAMKKNVVRTWGAETI